MNSSQRTASLSYSVEIKGLEFPSPIKVSRPRTEIAHLTLTTQRQLDKILLNIELEIDKLEESERQVADLRKKFVSWVELLVDKFVLIFSHSLNYVGSVRYKIGRICSEGRMLAEAQHNLPIGVSRSITQMIPSSSEEVMNYSSELKNLSKPSLQREIASKMLKTSLSVDDAVVSYLLLYNALSFVVEQVKSNSSQNVIDNFIKDDLGSSVEVDTRLGKSPKTPSGKSVEKWQETLFTKLRNDVSHAHDRSTDKFNWDETVSNIEGQLRELRKLVADAIKRYT